MPSSPSAPACNVSMRNRCCVRATPRRDGPGWLGPPSSSPSAAISRRTRVSAASRSVRPCSASARSDALCASAGVTSAPRMRHWLWTASATVASRWRRSRKASARGCGTSSERLQRPRLDPTWRGLFLRVRSVKRSSTSRAGLRGTALRAVAFIIEGSCSLGSALASAKRRLRVRYSARSLPRAVCAPAMARLMRSASPRPARTVPPELPQPLGDGGHPGVGRAAGQVRPSTKPLAAITRSVAVPKANLACFAAAEGRPGTLESCIP